MSLEKLRDQRLGSRMIYTSTFSTICTSGPSIFLTFLPSHHDMSPENIPVAHPSAIKVPVAQD